MRTHQKTHAKHEVGVEGPCSHVNSLLHLTVSVKAVFYNWGHKYNLNKQKTFYFTNSVKPRDRLSLRHVVFGNLQTSRCFLRSHEPVSVVPA